MVDDELKRLLDSMRQENSAAHEGTRRHFEVAMEATKHEVRLVAESVAHVSEELQREANAIRQEMSRGFAETQAMIKFSHAELDRRLSTLEESHNTLEETVADLQTRVQRLESGTH